MIAALPCKQLYKVGRMMRKMQVCGVALAGCHWGDDNAP
jgi:hypothetical protein